MPMQSQKTDAAHADAADPPAPFAHPVDVLALVTSVDPWSPAATVGAAIAARLGGNLTGCFVEPSARMRRDLLRGIAPVVIEEAKQCAA